MTTTSSPMPSRSSWSVTHRAQPASCSTAAMPETARRRALGEQAGEQDRADPAAELDDTAPPIEDDVVADRHQAGRPHRAGAPREVRPRECREGRTGSLVAELSTRPRRRRGRSAGWQIGRGHMTQAATHTIPGAASERGPGRQGYLGDPSIAPQPITTASSNQGIDGSNTAHDSTLWRRAQHHGRGPLRGTAGG